MANKSLNEVLGQDIKSVKELRAAIKEFQDTLVGADKESELYKETTDKLRVAQDELKEVTKAGREEVIQYSDSIAGLEKQYREMYNAYRQMSEEQRNSIDGIKQAKDLEELSNKLNDLKKSVGNYKDNIGRYAESVMDAFSKMGGSVGNLVGPFKTATQGINAFNTTLKANPIGAVVTLVMALVSAIKQLVGGLKDNEESQMRLNQAMASFQPMIDAAKNAMDKFGQAIVSVIEWIADVVDKIRVAKAAFTDFLGITKDAKKAVQEQQKVYQDLAKSVNELTLKKREYQKANAADKAEVERLREEASETTNLAEKRKLLQEAKDKQAEIDQRNIEIAKQELEILKVQDELTANSAEDNEKLAAAIAKVSEAEAQAAANMRNFNKQLNTVTKSTGSAASGMKNLAEEARKLNETTIENSKTELTKLEEKYQKEKKLLEKYHYDTTLLTKQYNENRLKLITDASNTAVQKSVSVYASMAKKYEDAESETFGQLSEFFRTEIDDVVDSIKSNTSSKKIFDKFVKDYFSIDKSLINWSDTAKDLVDEVNKTLGMNIKFPPDLDPKSIKNFEEKLDYIESLWENALNQMKSSAQKGIMTDNLTNNLNEILSKQIDAVFDIEDNNKYIEFLNETNREALELQAQYYGRLMVMDDLAWEEQIEAAQNYYAVIDELRQLDTEAAQLNAERTAQVWADAFSSFDTISNSVQSITNSYSQLMQAELQSGKLTEKEAKKKKKTMENLAKVTIAVNIAQIAASTAAGIMDVWKSYSSELALNAQTAAATGPALAAATKAALDAKSLASAILKTTGLGVNAAAQIAAARGSYVSTVNSLRDDGGAGSAAASVATPTEIDSTPYTYSRTLQTADEEERLNQPIWVSVTDIESGLNNKVKVTDESSF